MKKLSRESFIGVSENMKKYARPLEAAIFELYFHNGDMKKVLCELKKFQNEDGGFGHGIESDIRLPYSSPMATSVGIRHLSKIDSLEEAKEIIKKAIGYLECSYDKERNGWFSVSKEVNNFPHAPWWHYNEEDNMTIIDKNWGNPSAEIIAYLYKYREYVKTLKVDDLIEFAIKHIEDKESFNSEHEIFCYIELYEVLPIELKQRLEKKISIAIEEIIIYDERKWEEYIPKPLDFVESPKNCKFEIKKSKIENNLDFIIKELEVEEKINPSWGESIYVDELKPAYNEWIGTLTLNSLITLNNYERVEK